MKKGHLLALLMATGTVALAGCTTTPDESTNRTPATYRYDIFTNTLDFDEDVWGLPYDIWTPNAIFAHVGDTITINVHNIEKADEVHNFRVGAPFGIDRDIPQNESASFTITPTEAGIYSYVCTYHQPTMTGHLIVLG